MMQPPKPDAVVAIAAPRQVPHATPGKHPMENDGSRLADLTSDDIETLAADPAAVEIIKKICPECAEELDAMLMAEDTGPEEAGEMEPEPEMAPPAPQPMMARPQTRLAKV